MGKCRGCGRTRRNGAHRCPGCGGYPGDSLVAAVAARKQPHRAEVAKLLVHRRARRRGIAEGLMVAAEREAIGEHRALLTLDTASAEARRVYERLGWNLTGVIPGYALNPDRTPCDTWAYWKALTAPAVT
ncbi:MAG: GNAT family N-acetyltransferase [Dehalococcoidia bacterium]